MNAHSKYSLPSSQRRFALNFFLLYSIFAVITPYFPVLLKAQGFTKTNIGSIMACFAAMGVLSPFLWGYISDRARDRRPIIAFATLGACIMFLSFSRIYSLTLALLAAIAFGFFYRPIIPLVDGQVLRYIHEHGGDYGKPRASGSIAFIFWLIVLETIGISAIGSGRLIMFTAIIIFSLAHAGGLFLLPLTDRESNEQANRHIPVKRHFDWTAIFCASFLFFLFTSFLQRFAMMGQYIFFTLFVEEEIGYHKPGLLWMLGAVAEIPFLFFGFWFVRRVGVKALLAAGALAAMLRLIGYSIAPGPVSLALLQIFHAFTFGAYHIACVTYINRTIPADMKQSAMTIFVAGSLGLSSVLGSQAGGWLIDQVGYRKMYLVFASIAALAFLLTVLLIREPEQRKEIPENTETA
jgi:MFS transporter, PPP family, 3-phenylpropionic acid transporter